MAVCDHGTKHFTNAVNTIPNEGDKVITVFT